MSTKPFRWCVRLQESREIFLYKRISYFVYKESRVRQAITKRPATLLSREIQYNHNNNDGVLPYKTICSNNNKSSVEKVLRVVAC